MNTHDYAPAAQVRRALRSALRLLDSSPDDAPISIEVFDGIEQRSLHIIDHSPVESAEHVIAGWFHLVDHDLDVPGPEQFRCPFPEAVFDPTYICALCPDPIEEGSSFMTIVEIEGSRIVNSAHIDCADVLGFEPRPGQRVSRIKASVSAHRPDNL